nr:hypothetical protein CFP56_71939 [Quercus suber]
MTLTLGQRFTRASFELEDLIKRRQESLPQKKIEWEGGCGDDGDGIDQGAMEFVAEGLFVGGVMVLMMFHRRTILISKMPVLAPTRRAGTCQFLHSRNLPSGNCDGIDHGDRVCTWEFRFS